MKQNEGMLDRVIRVILSLVLFYGAMFWVASSWLRILMAVVGGVILVTAVTGFCAIYAIFKISTNKKTSYGETEKISDDSSNSQENLFNK